MPYISLLVSLAALVWGVVNHRRASEAEARLQNVRSSHFRLADQTRSQLESLTSELRLLQQQQRAQQGTALFHPEMTVADALARDARAADVMGAFHIGGCDGCAVSPDETLRHAAEGNGQDMDALLAALNQLDDPQAEIARKLARRPNVQITL